MSYTTNMWYPRWELRSEEAVSFQDCKVIETFIKGFYLQPALSLSLSSAIKSVPHPAGAEHFSILC